MKFIIVDGNGVVLDCLSELADGAISITDEQARVFRYTKQHSEYKYANGELVKNLEYAEPVQPFKLSETDKIWQALDKANLGVVIPDDVKAKLDKVK